MEAAERTEGRWLGRLKKTTDSKVKQGGLKKRMVTDVERSLRVRFKVMVENYPCF